MIKCIQTIYPFIKLYPYSIGTYVPNVSVIAGTQRNLFLNWVFAFRFWSYDSLNGHIGTNLKCAKKLKLRLIYYVNYMRFYHNALV